MAIDSRNIPVGFHSQGRMEQTLFMSDYIILDCHDAHPTVARVFLALAIILLYFQLRRSKITSTDNFQNGQAAAMDNSGCWRHHDQDVY
jgi:hypothetical protein